MMKLSHYWRNWVLGCVFVALIGIQLIESTHHHESEAQADDCPVCQLVVHQALDIPLPAVVQIATLLLVLFVLACACNESQITESRYNTYSSRAPPFLTPH
jgi:hypothetical protein